MHDPVPVHPEVAVRQMPPDQPWRQLSVPLMDSVRKHRDPHRAPATTQIIRHRRAPVRVDQFVTPPYIISSGAPVVRTSSKRAMHGA